MRYTYMLLTVLFAAMAARNAAAHAYIKNNGDHTSAATAILIEDMDVSRVVYHEATDSRPRVWLKIEAEAGQTASIQVGVPHVAGLEGYRPAFALLGPGLPELDLPFETPEGYGGIVYTTDDVAAPEVFHEEFTGTASWVFTRQEIPLSQSGLYYIVGYVPSGQPGKFWVAPGVREYFTFRDILSLPWVIYKVRTFHEVFPVGGILSWVIMGIFVIGAGLLL